MTLMLADIPKGSEAVWLCLSLSIVRLTELVLFGLYRFYFSVRHVSAPICTRIPVRPTYACLECIQAACGGEATCTGISGT